MDRESSYYESIDGIRSNPIIKNGYNNLYKQLSDSYSDTNLRKIAKYGHVHILRSISNVDYDTFEDLIRSAFQYNQTICAKYLMSSDKSNQLDTQMVSTMLQYAVTNGNITLIKLIIRRWPKTDLSYGLEDAFESKSLKTIRYLVDIGADFSKEDLDLMNLAVETGNIFIVKYVLRIGVRLDIEKESILSTAVTTGNLDLVKFLFKLGFKATNDSLTCALNFKYLDIAQYLIDNGANITTYDFTYDDLNDKNFLTEILPFIASKTNINLSSIVYPLNNALSRKQYKIIDLLLKYCADLMMIYKSYLTVLPLDRVVYLLQREPRLAMFVTPTILKFLHDRGHTDLVDLVETYKK
jgi:ankyrin repeat protein